jgi:hypothetical protein
MDEEKLINNLLHKTNKEITKLKYEGEFFNRVEIKEMIEILQYHIFLVHTYFDKSEFSTSDVRSRLLEKLKSFE